jgi:hypothetical protein
MPKGVYTGFNVDKSVCNENELIALLGCPSKPDLYPKALIKGMKLLYKNWLRLLKVG